MDTLPEDIHYVVLDQLSNDPTQILEFTLVCRSWMSYCRNLYGTIYPFRILVSMSQQPNRALDALLPPASFIRNYVRHLRIVGPEVTPTCSKSRVRPPLYELYVNLAHELLQLHGLILPLRTLGFDHVNWSNWPRSMYTELVQVLATSCTRLITLDFSHSKFNGPTIPLSFQLYFPFIRSLYLRDCVMTHELPLISAQSLHTSYSPNLTSLVLEGDLDFTLLMLRGLLTCPSFTTHLTICASWDEDASQALQDFLKHLGPVLRFLKVGLLRGSDDDFPISLEHNTELVTLYLGLSGPEIVGQPYPWLIRMIESLASPSFMKLFLDFTQVSSANTLESVFKRMVDWSSLERVLIERHSMRHLPLVHLLLPSSPHLEISKWVESLLSTIHREGKLVVLQEN